MRLKDFDPNQVFDKVTEDLASYIYERDCGLCQICTKQGTERHHIVYRSKCGKNCAMNLILLCNGCHRNLHDVSDRRRNQLLLRVIENESRFRKSIT